MATIKRTVSDCNGQFFIFQLRYPCVTRKRGRSVSGDYKGFIDTSKGKRFKGYGC